MKLIVNEGQRREVELKPNQNLEIFLIGRGANVNVHGIWMGRDNQHLANNLIIVHSAPETMSKVAVKGVMFNQAEVNFYGLIRIEKGANGANCFLRADFLLFDKAKAKPQPFLEILENEVQAGHAATISRVDEGQLFYLMSRGLTKKRAEKLIIDGFCDSFPTSYERGWD